MLPEKFEPHVREQVWNNVRLAYLNLTAMRQFALDGRMEITSFEGLQLDDAIKALEGMLK